MAQTKVQLLQPNLGDVIDFDSSTLFMDGADNRVGIRNTNPQYELDVTGTVNATNFRGNISVGTIDDWITHTGDTNTKIGFPGNDQFEIHAGGGPKVHVNSSGYVGIGTSTMSNAERLAVQLGNDEMFELRSAAQELFQVWKEGSTEECRLNVKHGGATKIHIRGNGASYFNGGNVGISIANPSAKLDVEGGTKATQYQLKKAGNAASIGAFFELTNQGGDSSSNDVTLSANNSTNSVVLRAAAKVSAWVYRNSAYQEGLRIENTGEVWIKDGTLKLGTTSGSDSIIHTSNAAGILYRADENGHRFQTYVSGWQDRLKIHDDGKISFGTTSGGYGQWAFLNIGSSGGDATGGELGLTIRSDEGFTNTNITGTGGWTLKLRNNAYAGSGVSGNQGTVAKLLFSGVTSNGHNSFVNIGCDTQGTGANKGDFFVTTGGSAERLRIDSNGMSKFTRGSTGTVGHFYANARECNILLQNDAQTWKIVNYDYGNNGTDNLGFHDGTADRLVIAKNGKIGINKTMPTTALLEINNTGGAVQGLDVYTNDVGTTAIAKFRGYNNTHGAQDRLIITAKGTLQLNADVASDTEQVAHFQAVNNNKHGILRVNGHSGTNAVQGILELIGYAAGGGHGRHAFITASTDGGTYATRMDFKMRETSAQWQHPQISEKLTLHPGFTGTVDVKGIPATLRLYSQRDTSNWDAEDPIGNLDFYVGSDSSNNLPYTTNFVRSISSHLDNQNEPGGHLIFGSCYNNQSGGAVETMRLSHDPSATDKAHLQTRGIGAIRDVYDMMNINPAGTGFDHVSNNEDGGATYWEIQDSRTIRLHSTSGGHGGQWGKKVLIRQDGWYYWRMCVRVTTTCGAIHGSTSTSKYKYPIGFYFNMGTSGNANACTGRIWNEFATTGTCNGSQSGTGSLDNGTKVTKTGIPTYLTKGIYQPQYHTNGYQGVRELNIYSLELVMTGARSHGYENNGTY